MAQVLELQRIQCIVPDVDIQQKYNDLVMKVKPVVQLLNQDAKTQIKLLNNPEGGKQLQ